MLGGADRPTPAHPGPHVAYWRDPCGGRGPDVFKASRPEPTTSLRVAAGWMATSSFGDLAVLGRVLSRQPAETPYVTT